MKKQILLTAVIISGVLFSCTKEKLATPQAGQSEQPLTNSYSSRLVMDPLKVNLDGWFAFNGNLKDATNHLADGIATSRLGAIYTYDRHGISKAAIKFNGTYGVKLFKVPQSTHASVAAWVKYDNPNAGTGRMIVKPKDTGLGIYKWLTEMGGTVESPNFGSLGLAAGTFNSSWHHFVVTFDDADLRVYVDGTLKASIPCGGTYANVLEDYFIGYFPNEYFEGSVDDLRFYSRTLSASDVTALYNL
jgi:concanavalin A-like lectin/glucanase superfamily protein